MARYCLGRLGYLPYRLAGIAKASRFGIQRIEWVERRTTRVIVLGTAIERRQWADPATVAIPRIVPFGGLLTNLLRFCYAGSRLADIGVVGDRGFALVAGRRVDARVPAAWRQGIRRRWGDRLAGRAADVLGLAGVAVGVLAGRAASVLVGLGVHSGGLQMQLGQQLLQRWRRLDNGVRARDRPGVGSIAWVRRDVLALAQGL